MNSNPPPPSTNNLYFGCKLPEDKIDFNTFCLGPAIIVCILSCIVFCYGSYLFYKNKKKSDHIMVFSLFLICASFIGGIISARQIAILRDYYELK